MQCTVRILSVVAVGTMCAMSADATNHAGLAIKSDNATIIMGAEGDVSIWRSGANSLGIEADATAVSGDVSIAGALVVNGADFDETVSSLAAGISSSLATISANSADIATNAAALTSLAGEVSSNTGGVSSNAATMLSLIDDIASNAAAISSNAAVLSSLESDVDVRLSALEKSTLCSREDCCDSSYTWSGTDLKCWSSHYTNFEDDPCSCRGKVYDLGSSTAFDHEANCVANGGHLMSIHGPAQNAIVAAYGANVWIGLFDRKSEGTFHWFDGTPATYDSWNTNEPNDSSGEDCVHTTGTNLLWNDLGCDSAVTYKGMCLFQ